MFSAIIVFTQNEYAEQIDNFFKKAQTNNFSGNVLVVHEGKIILKEGYGWKDRETEMPEDGNSVFDVGSITKQFTGAAILKLEMQGKLKTSDLLSKYFPEIPADKKNITLHHLLTHSAGFPGAIGDDFEQISSEDFMKLAFNEELLFTPGEMYEYSNVGFSILGILVEKLSGKTYEQFLHDEIFVPAGMLHTGYIIPQYDPNTLSVGYSSDGERWGTMTERFNGVSPGWHLKANGGILSTLDDMYNWTLALEGEKILNNAAKEKYFTPHIKEYPDGDTYYGYGWVIMDSPEGKMIWHNGGNGISLSTFMGFNQQTKTCVIVNVNIGGKVSDDYALKIYDILRGINEVPDPELIKKSNGIYALDEASKITVEFDEFDRLIVLYSTPAAFNVLISDGTEKKEIVEKYNSKTQEMLSGLFSENYQLIADAWDMPAEEFANGPGEMWKQTTKENGGFINTEILGTAFRPQMNIYITVARINFKEDVVYMMYVWNDQTLRDARELETPDKMFEWENNNIFSAPNNNKKIVLEDGSLKIVSEMGVTTAKKIDN
jgi:CubicO group peptidase (beta-lactamase class C family)